MSIKINVSIGELWDKFTILLIKQEKIKDIDKLNKVKKEISLLDKEMNKYDYHNNNLFIQLKEVNDNLWKIEDKIRIKEKDKLFDQEFIDLARRVYYENDKRALIKKNINIIYNSEIEEVKHYTYYSYIF